MHYESLRELIRGDRYWHRAVLLIAALAGGIIAIAGIPALRAIFPTPQYLGIHTLAEMASVVVSISVFTVAWYTFRQTENRRDLFISVTFLLVGIVDLVHTLSYNGMPEFLGHNSVSKASTYWIFARLFGAAGLFLSAFISPTSRRRWLSPMILLPMALGSAVALVLVVSYHPEVLPAMYQPGVGQTRIKILLEYAVMALNFGAILAYMRQPRPAGGPIRLLQAALLTSILSELAFTLYSSAFDSYNLLGHIYKILAYYFILRALFVSSIRRPYEELYSAKEDLRAIAAQKDELYRESQAHKRELEQSFALIGAALGSRLDLNQTLELIARLASDIFHSPHALVAMDEGTGKLRISARIGLESLPETIPLEGTLAGRVLKERTPLWVTGSESLPEMEGIRIGEDRVRSAVVAPILSGGELRGVIGVFSKDEAAFGPAEAELLLTFSRQAGVAIDNATLFEQTTRSLEHERRIVEVLQSSILPPVLPSVPEFEMGKFYEAAREEAQIGGDFYDVFLLPNGSLALAIGDVSGKGLAAAKYTAMAKYALRAYVLEDPSPGRVLERLNRSIAHAFETPAGGDAPESVEAQFITLFYGILDRKRLELVYASAGHEPGILLRGRSEEAELLGPTGAAAGMTAFSKFDEARTLLAPGDLLALYTDGITDARGPAGFLDVEGLVHILKEHRRKPAQDLCSVVRNAAMAHAGGRRHDDIALLITRVVGHG